MQDQQSRPDMTENQSRLESKINFQYLRKLGLSFKALKYLWRIADAHISSPAETKKSPDPVLKVFEATDKLNLSESTTEPILRQLQMRPTQPLCWSLTEEGGSPSLAISTVLDTR